MTKQEREKRDTLLQKQEDDRNKEWKAEKKRNTEMQKELTKLAVNYSEFIGKMNNILDKCQPLIEKYLKQLSDN